MLSKCKHSIKPHSGVALWIRMAVGFSAMIMSAAHALACSCSSVTICDLVQAPIIFIGEVIDGGITSIRQDPWDLSTPQVRLKVLERFRGLSKDQQTVDINIVQMPGMCAANPYHLGKRYLVTPYIKDGSFYDGPCFNGRDVDRFDEGVRYVREYFSGKKSINVYGKVGIDLEYVKPLAGVMVSTSRDGKVYSALTGQDGRYTLFLPSLGTYEIRAALKPYSSASARISVARVGCAIKDFELTVNNTISGRVLDENGQPLKDAKVGLIDLDDPSNPESRAVAHAYADKPDMSFTITNIPIGRYLLLFNPDGPRSGRLFDLPRESTFYPLNSTRASAIPIEIKSGGVHITGMDLSVGNHVEFRRISVRVKFPDGTPMKTAEVVCMGLPLQEGDLPWIGRNFARLNKANHGSIELLAPANRKLRLEVRDSYGREITGVYSSFHEAGITPIEQEFIVTP